MWIAVLYQSAGVMHPTNAQGGSCIGFEEADFLYRSTTQRKPLTKIVERKARKIRMNIRTTMTSYWESSQTPNARILLQNK